jgi:hypothetical protein
LENKNSQNEELKEVLRIEKQLLEAVEKWKESKKEEMVEHVKEMLIKSEHQRSQEVIKEIRSLEEFRFITNIEILKRFDKFTENLSIEKENNEMEEIDYSQIKMDYEFKENKQIIENIFEEKLIEKGFTIEEKVEGMTKVRNEGVAYYLFEKDKERSLATQINEKIKYTTLLIAVQTLSEEKEVEIEINEWLNSDAKSQTIKKYIKLNVTSQERLMGQENPIKSIKIA